MIFIAFLIRLLQLSAAGEVFLEGTCPLSRCPQTAKLPAPCFWRTGKVGEKSDSFSRAERTRPLRPVCRLLLCDFGNVPVERFQRDFPLPKSTDTAQPVPTGNDRKSMWQNKKMKKSMPPLKGVTPHGVGRCPKGRGDRSVRGGPPLGGGEVFWCNLCGDPSVSAAHCQLPFQGSLISLIFLLTDPPLIQTIEHGASAVRIFQLGAYFHHLPYKFVISQK
jgi:hypothetical protein